MTSNTDSASQLTFSCHASDGAARAGEFCVRGRRISTPVFMPVGTAASVKTLGGEDLEALGAEIVLANTYHLHLRPGAAVVERAGGVADFMAFDGAALTDSGGYQVYSLKDRCSIEADGVRFQSHLDGGDEHFFTPEGTLDIQRGLGTDVAMALDVCTANPSDHAASRAAMETTLDWAERTGAYRAATAAPNDPAVFGITQGGVHHDLRAECADRLREMDFDGLAIGGLSVGESKEALLSNVEVNVAHSDPAQPRYLMGVGTPVDIVEAVARGVDMFDCVLPTRNARNGQAFTSQGVLGLRGAALKDDRGPLDPGCECQVCCRYERAYVRHLFNAGEILGMRLATWHNLAFYLTLTRRLRAAIQQGRFGAFAKEFLAEYGSDSSLEPRR